MNEPSNPGGTYINPVYGRSFPDPFVLKFCGEYWGYSTGFWRDGRCFGVMHSTDLVRWREFSGAMEPLPGDHPCYWAPEVSYDNGLFYMYYSVGNEEFMEIRVATSRDPAGPFVDSGRRLTSEPFAIDAHIFEDDDGARYMFYATDFLEHTHIGTGTVMDRMLDPYTLAGQARPVTRARFDWQVYDPQRKEKGGVRWHTVEGPFVLKYKGRYYQMFSGGNWKNMTYGVSYAVTSDIDDPDEWAQASDGERVLPILRTVPGLVIGPGHNSVVRGPDNRQLFCVYHRWDEASDARVLCIDRQEWVGERIVVLGPTTEPQPAPIEPAVRGFGGGEWEFEGDGWVVRDGAAVRESSVGPAAARCAPGFSCFTAEVSLLSPDADSGEGRIGASIFGDGEEALRFALLISEKKAVVSARSEAGWGEQLFDLPRGFRPDAFHLLRIEADELFASIALDQTAVRWSGPISSAPRGVALLARDAPAAFAGFSLTAGWQELFIGSDANPSRTGWQQLTPQGRWYMDGHNLRYSNASGQPGLITRGPLFDSYEFVVNARLDIYGEGGLYGFYPALGAARKGPLFTVERAGKGWSLLRYEPSLVQTIALPGDFDPFTPQQFRFRKQGGRLSVRWGAHMLGSAGAPSEATRPGLYARAAGVSFDMARVTVIVDNVGNGTSPDVF